MRYDARERVLLIISGHSITTAELKVRENDVAPLLQHCSACSAGGRSATGSVSIVVAHSDAVSATK